MKQIKKIAFIFAAAILCGLAIQGQTTSVFTTGLQKPSTVITAADDSFLVSESGTPTPNTGRISLVNRTTGVRRTLVGGLPSGISNLGGPPEPSGPSRLRLHGHSVYLAIGPGDAVWNVGPGLESPNPTPSSPLFDSVLELNLPGNYPEVTDAFMLSFADQTALAGGEEITLTNSDGQTMTIRMVVNLPNYMPNPRSTAPNNVRASNVFGIEIFQKNLYVVDASLNSIYRVDISSGDYETFVSFPSKPNPLFPTIGGPFVEAVPDNVHRVGNRLLVPLLTGFPFVQNFAEVRAVNLKGGEQETFIPNLTSAIDILHVETGDLLKDAGDGGSYYTLEFSTNQLANAPGRLRFYSTSDAAPVVVAANLISPTSMARDEASGDIFVTNIFPGTITRVQIP